MFNGLMKGSANMIHGIRKLISRIWKVISGNAPSSSRSTFGQDPIAELIERGMKVGKNVHIMSGTFLDPSRPFLIEIGNNVTLSGGCHILTHDASMNKSLGFTKVGKVKILDNSFIGARTVILPNVSIGPNSIVGAGSVVTRNVEPFAVFAGNPARKVSSYEAFLNKHQQYFKEKNKYPYERFHGQFINKTDEILMSKELDSDFGYSVGGLQYEDRVKDQ